MMTDRITKLVRVVDWFGIVGNSDHPVLFEPDRNDGDALILAKMLAKRGYCVNLRNRFSDDKWHFTVASKTSTESWMPWKDSIHEAIFAAVLDLIESEKE